MQGPYSDDITRRGYGEGSQVPTTPTLRPPKMARRPRRRRGRRGCWRTFLTIGGMVLASALASALIAGLVIYRSLSDELAADMEKLEAMAGVETFQTTRVFDRNGNLLYEIFDEGRRTEIPLDQIPFAMRWAIIATEDDSFYDNLGFDPQSILRAAWQWMQEGEIVSGASTITQQLVRQIVFSYDERNELTLRRKLKEAALAWVMTQQYSKDEILELYLNEIYYGNLAYGIEGAANVYFDKHATELSIAESAFLAGLVQSPATYDPYTDFAAAKFRQRQVLDLMVLHGYLSPQDADAAFNESPLTVADLASPNVALEAPHFTVAARLELERLPGIDPAMVSRGGLRVYTTLDLNMQNLAQEIVAAHVAETRDLYNMHNAALVAINPNNGEILAMLGSVDYDDTSIDGNVNVILSPQQPGSSMKPLTYAAALEQGWQPADILWDVPMAYSDGMGGEYQPVNYDERFHGPVRLRDALANSYNIPAVTLLREVGVSNLLEIGERFGIESLGRDPSKYGLSLTLGGGELTPLELTAAYGVFANGGHLVEPHLIMRVEDGKGNVLYTAPTELGEGVLDQRIAFVISSILSDNQARTPAMGPDSDLKLEFPAAAKTGTTNDFRDNWTVGYTPHLVVGVWAGNTDNSPMAEGTSGLTGAAPIWHDFMDEVYLRTDLLTALEGAGLPPLRVDFTPPSGLEQRSICVLSSLKDPAAAADGCPRTRPEWFLVHDAIFGAQPTDVPTPTATPIPAPDGGEPLPPVMVEIEPGIWALGVLKLEGEYQQAISAGLPSIEGVTPSPPLYCEVPQEHADLTVMMFQLFIAAPSDPADAVRARNWAYAHNIPIVPGVACPPDLIGEVDQGGPPGSSAEATYMIDSPKPDEGVYGVIPIIGTAHFDPKHVLFYKLEIGSGSIPDQWVTFGETHRESVVNGVLEYLHADALPPGPYVIRLVLVLPDGNFLPPYMVPITILAEAPTPSPTP